MSIEARLSRFTEIATRLDESVALLAAFELGVFDALRMGPLLSAELAARCGAAERRLRAILDVVVCLGYLERHDGHYSLVDGDEALFEPGSPWLQSMHFMDLRGFLEGRGRILDVLRSDEPLPVAGTGGPASPEERRHFLHFLHHRSQNAAEEVADLLASDEIGTFADRGCGLGTYSIALLKLMPNARAVLVDRRNAEEAISEMVEEEGLADRVTFLPVDFLEADFGQDFDLVLVSNVMHCLSPEENRVLARRAARSLKYGARLAVKDIGVQPDRSGPPSALRFGMNMAISSRGGDVYSEKEVVGWVEEAGLEHEATLQLRSASSAYLVVSTRPPSGAGHTVSLVQVRDAQRHSDRIVILGGGIAGLATSIALRERGFHTDSYERVQAFRGRGLAFIVMPRGLRSIERLGGGASIRRLGAIVDRALIRTRRDEPIVRRSELVFLLRSLLPQDSMHRGMEFTGFRRDRSGEVVGANFEFGDVARGAAFIGADGVRSRVRQALFPDHRLNEVRVVELVSMVRAPELAEALGTTFIKTVDDEGGLACGVVPCGFGGGWWAAGRTRFRS